MTLASCDLFAEATLVGNWRSEDNNQVHEIACRSDQSFTSWTDQKNELTTPSIAISAGLWKVRNNELIVHFTKAVAVDSWSKEDKLIKFIIMKLQGDELALKNVDGRVLTYRRFAPECALPPMKRAPTDADLVGTWQIHYHTRDYEMTFNPDHTCGDFAWIEGERKQFFAGIWRIEGDQLIVDAKSVPMFEGDPIHKSWLKWVVTGTQPQRIAIKDGPVSYCMERLK